MYPTDGLITVLVPKLQDRTCPDRRCIQNTFKSKTLVKCGTVDRALPEEDISLLSAAEMTDMNIDSFKDILKVRGLKVSSYIGSKEEIERGLRLF